MGRPKPDPDSCARCQGTGTWTLPPLTIRGQRIHNGRTLPCKECDVAASWGAHTVSHAARQFRLPGSGPLPPSQPRRKSGPRLPGQPRDG